MPNFKRDNVIAALILYRKRIDVLKNETIATVEKTETQEISELEGALHLSLLGEEVDEILECLDVLTHLLAEII